MAGGYSVVVAGTTITASRENTYVSRQVITRFASLTAAQSAISTDAEEGMYVDAADTNILYRYNGSAYVPAIPGLVGTKYATGGTLATGVGAEAAMTAWTGGDSTVTFVNGYIYELALSVGAADSGTAGTGGAALVRVRRTVNSTSAAVLMTKQAMTSGGGAVKCHDFRAYVKNASGADIAASLGLTVQNLVGGNGVIYGDATLPVILNVYRIGPTADYSSLGNIANAIT
jgi:hypothetical protein